MRRREFIALLGATVWPLAGRAQQAMPVIGFLSSRSPAEFTAVVAAFRQGLRELGFVEGQNLVIAFRWAEGRYDQLPALAADLVGLRVAVLLTAGGPPSAHAAKAATSTIPIVFSAASDPVRVALVSSLSRPGGNITGMGTFNAPSAGPKRTWQLAKLLRLTLITASCLVSPRLAQEAGGRCCSRSLIKTLDRISEGPPRGGLSSRADHVHAASD